jgi:hypothetical protein
MTSQSTNTIIKRKYDVTSWAWYGLCCQLLRNVTVGSGSACVSMICLRVVE